MTFQIIAAFSRLINFAKKFAHSRFYTVSTLSTFSTPLCLSCDRRSWRVLDNSGLRQLSPDTKNYSRPISEYQTLIYTTRNGLLDDFVYRVLEDGEQNLWLSCRKGIFHISKKELDDFASGRIASVAPVAYGTADGMMTRECRGDGDPARVARQGRQALVPDHQRRRDDRP